MRTILWAIATSCLIAVGACNAHAADLGKPATAPAAAIADIPDQWTGLYFEGGTVGQFTKAGDKSAAGLLGIGYNAHTRGTPWVVGALVRYGFSAEGNSDAAVLTFDQPLTGAVRMGYLAYPSTLIYGIAGYAKSLKTDYRGPLAGLGAEFPVLGSLRLGIEYTAQFDRSFKADADVIHNVGVFARLPF